MKGIVITTKDEIYTADFLQPYYETIGKVVDGWIDIVHPMLLKNNFVMVVNDDGLIKELPRNRLGSFLYGTPMTDPIVGNIVICKEGYTENGLDLIDAEEHELEELFNAFKGFDLKDISNEKGEQK